MIVDTHTHVYPDAVAKKAIPLLQKSSNVPAYTDGTVSGLLASMKKSGVLLSLCLPVMTNPSQFEHLNLFSAEVDRTEGLRSFGGIHPDCEGIGEKLDFIKSLGLTGVKLHPAYQKTDIDDKRYLKIVAGCRERGLKIYIHAGTDPAFPDHDFCPPEKSAKLIDRFADAGEEPFIALAHFGGLERYEDAEKYLWGKPVYIDLSFALDYVSKDLVLRFISLHGTDRVLFGTDSPWRSAEKYISIVRDLGLSDEDTEKIFSKNAMRFLSLPDA